MRLQRSRSGKIPGRVGIGDPENDGKKKPVRNRQADAKEFVFRCMRSVNNRVMTGYRDRLDDDPKRGKRKRLEEAATVGEMEKESREEDGRN